MGRPRSPKYETTRRKVAIWWRVWAGSGSSAVAKWLYTASISTCRLPRRASNSPAAPSGLTPIRPIPESTLTWTRAVTPRPAAASSINPTACIEETVMVRR